MFTENYILECGNPLLRSSNQWYVCSIQFRDYLKLQTMGKLFIKRANQILKGFLLGLSECGKAAGYALQH